MFNTDLIVKHTKNWISSFIIPLQLCPFAKYVVDNNIIQFKVSLAQTKQAALADLHEELKILEANQTIETSLVIFPVLFKDFLVYLDFIDLAEKKFIYKQYAGIYQLATFHPDYCFADAIDQDVTNYTNRSPYPMIHILREDSVEKAIAFYGDTEKIPLNNMALLRHLGIEKVKALLSNLEEITPK
ncbi:DUF1415 domain-containing protein [Legionella sp. D16C41]|uniref:DUF1415 domain-containing protein n=1 Tax=Legionella sp. D16C41 TaxID=3402688 RepID=UPI003AF8DB7C